MIHLINFYHCRSMTAYHVEEKGIRLSLNSVAWALEFALAKNKPHYQLHPTEYFTLKKLYKAFPRDITVSHATLKGLEVPQLIRKSRAQLTLLGNLDAQVLSYWMIAGRYDEDLKPHEIFAYNLLPQAVSINLHQYLQQ